MVQQVAQTLVRERVYNLRVAEFNTYFVGCDEWGFSVWAHNQCVYHGTSKEMALDIVANGLNVAKWNAAQKELGGGDEKGFSVSTKIATATAWAATRAA